LEHGWSTEVDHLDSLRCHSGIVWLANAFTCHDLMPRAMVTFCQFFQAREIPEMLIKPKLKDSLFSLNTSRLLLSFSFRLLCF
jgi:hypothetical protein